MILILGGTTEGRVLAEMLSRAGYNCILSVASTLGGTFAGNIVEIQVGPLTPDSLQQLIEERDISLIIDATHPYALLIKEIAQTAAAEHHLEYWRLERPQAFLPDIPGIIRVVDYTQALSVLTDSGGGIFFTIGVKNLHIFSELWKTGRPVWVKVYPEAESLEQCKSFGLRPEQIFANLTVGKRFRCFRFRSLNCRDGRRHTTCFSPGRRPSVWCRAPPACALHVRSLPASKRGFRDR